MIPPILLDIIKRIIDQVFPDPKEKAELEKRLSDEFARFIEATQPKSSDIYRWASTLIALVRPALAVFVVVSPIVWTDRWLSFLGVLKEAGVWGVIALSPAWVWILGRDGLRLILGVVATMKGQKIPEASLPPGIPGPSTNRPYENGYHENDWGRPH